MPRVVYHGGRAELLDLFGRQLPKILEGRGDRADLMRGLQLRLGVVLLSKIQQAFVVKSRGGVGSDGIRWKPLRPETIAQRRATAAERKQLGIGGKRVRGLLTPAEDKRWRAIFYHTYASLVAKYGMSDKEAKGKAAAKAWNILKSEGAKTKLAVLGGRQVDIGRDTGRLFKSLSPGVEDRPSGAAEQIFETPPGAVTVGTNVVYASRFHALRPLWPRDGNIPDAWWPDLLKAALRGMAKIGVQLVR